MNPTEEESSLEVNCDEDRELGSVIGNGGAAVDSGARARERSQGGARRRDAIAAGGGVAARHSGSSRWQANGRAATALSWSPAPMRWHGPRVARSRLRASGGGATGSALARLPPTRRHDPHPRAHLVSSQAGGSWSWKTGPSW